MPAEKCSRSIRDISDIRGEAKTGNAANHNMILVDGAGPQIGDLQNSNDADGFIQNAFDKEKLDYGEVQTSYQNASITRRFLFIRNKYFINSDYVSASSNHDFAWQLHGYGIEGGTAGDEGSFTDNLANGEGIWTKGTMSLLAHTAVEGGASSYSKTTAEHEYDFDSARTHTVMLAVKNSVSSTGFLSALYPYSSAPAQITTLNSSYYTALRVNDSPYADIAAMKQDTILRTMDTSVTHLPRSLSSDGTFLLLSHKTTVDMNEQWFAIGAKHLYYGADSLFTANARVTLSVQQTSDYQLSGYCSQAAEIVIFVGANAQSVNGNNISSWLFINQDYISITFSGESYFKINTSTPLPVELTAFNAERTSSGVLLNWATATEVNLQEFQIERKSGTGNWMKIGFIPGHGNSSTPQEYSFPDDNVVAGENHYRLKMVDFDGTFHYSKELLINIPPIRSYALYQNYPNPFNPTTTISYQIPQAGLVTLKVYDMLGREVATLVNSHQEVGSYNVTFDANKLNSGVYFYTLQAGEFAATKKLLLLK
jgi:hypothetical protein